MPNQRNDLAIVKFLQKLHDRIDDMDDNSYDNTTIQFFVSPHDTASLTASISAYVAPANINANPQETVKFTSQVNASSANPTTFTYGGYDTFGNFYNAGWYWGYGGVWL